MVMSSPLAGAEIRTFFAPPPSMCARALAASVKRPVDSMTTSTPRSLPRQLARVALGEDRDSAIVDRQRVAAAPDAPRVGPVVAVVLEEVGALGGARQVVDGGDLDRRMTLDQRLGKISSDAAEAVDSDAHGSASYRTCFRAPLPAAQPLGQARKGGKAAADGRFGDRRIAAPPQLRERFVGMCQPQLGDFAQRRR